MCLSGQVIEVVYDEVFETYDVFFGDSIVIGLFHLKQANVQADLWSMYSYILRMIENNCGEAGMILTRKWFS